jgi:hypothetical protein
MRLAWLLMAAAVLGSCRSGKARQTPAPALSASSSAPVAMASAAPAPCTSAGVVAWAWELERLELADVAQDLRGGFALLVKHQAKRFASDCSSGVCITRGADPGEKDITRILRIDADGRSKSEQRLEDPEAAPDFRMSHYPRIGVGTDGTLVMGVEELMWPPEAAGRAKWQYRPRCPLPGPTGQIWELSPAPDGGFVAILRCSSEKLVVLRIDARGEPRFEVPVASKELSGRAVVDRQGNTVIGGRFGGKLRFGAVKQQLAASGEYDGYLASFDPEGGLRWQKRLGQRFDDAVEGLAATAHGVAVVGFEEPRDGDSDAFVAEFDTEGRELWRRRFAESIVGYGSQNQRATDVAVSGSGNLFVTGTFSWDMQVEGISLRDPLHRGTATNSQDADVFVLELDPSGKVRWAHVVRQTWGDSPRLWAEQSSASGDKVTLEVGVAGAKNDTKRLFGLCPPRASQVHAGLLVTPDPGIRPKDTRIYATWQSLPVRAPRDGAQGSVRLLEDSRVTSHGARRQGYSVSSDPTLLPARFELLDEAGKVRAAVGGIMPEAEVTARELGDGKTTFFVTENYECSAGIFCGSPTRAYQVDNGKLSVLTATDERGNSREFYFVTTQMSGWGIVPADVAPKGAPLHDVVDAHYGMEHTTTYTRFFWDGTKWRSRSLSRGGEDPAKFPVPRPSASAE